MSDAELKQIWNRKQDSPEVDFGKLPELISDWQKNIKRKIKIEMIFQASTAVLPFISVYYFPKMIFACILILLLGIWYLPELRGLYRLDEIWTGKADFKTLLLSKILNMKRFFFRTRFVMYVLTPLIMPCVSYGLGYIDKPFSTSMVIKSLVFFEVLVVIATEIYFAILYKPPFSKLQKLLSELEE